MPLLERPKKDRKPVPSLPAPPVAQAQLALDLSVPLDDRVALLASFLATPSPEALETVRFLVRSAEHAHGHTLYLAKAQELTDTLAQMQAGPCRPAIFLGLAGGLSSRLTETGLTAPRAAVALEDGMKVFVAIPEADLVPQLAPGTPVVLDGRASALLGVDDAAATATGEVATFERRIGEREIEVSLRGDQQRLGILPSPALLAEIEAGRVVPGATVLVNSRQLAASGAVVEAKEKWAHYKHLHRAPVPVVRVTDLACPHAVIGDIDRHIRTELESPEIHRRYGVSASLFRVLTGPTGTGKTVTIRAVHHGLREQIARRLAIPLEEVPPRAFFVRADMVLSKWLGDSEKAFARIMDEVLQVAREPVMDEAGVGHLLPVLLVIEEMEALARARGGELESPTMDRILGTFLQVLDPGRPEFREVCVVCLATTNTPDLVDPAFARRVGAKLEVFPRLNRASFGAVLRQHVQHLPVASHNGSSPAELWSRHVHNLTALLFGPGSEPVLELTLAGTTTPLPKYVRDFLTPSLVQRAVEEAAREAVRREIEGRDPVGLTVDAVLGALEGQVRALLDCVRENNAGLYVDLPQGSRVAALRRLPMPPRPATDFLAGAD